MRIEIHFSNCLLFLFLKRIMFYSKVLFSLNYWILAWIKKIINLSGKSMSKGYFLSVIYFIINYIIIYIIISRALKNRKYVTNVTWDPGFFFAIFR
jgi:hypothetical protein